jgi:hypothetical protein
VKQFLLGFFDKKELFSQKVLKEKDIYRWNKVILISNNSKRQKYWELNFVFCN